MKKVLRTVILSALFLLMPALSMAQTTTTVVADGTTTNSYVPVYGFYVDAYLRCQSVYPDTMLTDLTVGDSIKGLTFYSSTASASWGAATFDVKLSEVESATISAFYPSDDFTTVYSGSLSIVGNQMAIVFTEPYIYMGGNLLVEVVSTATGSYVSSSFLGVSVSNSTVQGYSYSNVNSITPSQRNFLAKMQIEYAAGEPPTCFKVRNLAASVIDSDEITLTWLDIMNSGASYTVAYWTATGDTNYTTATDTFVTVTGLTPATHYFFAVTPDCSDGTTANPATANYITSCGVVGVPYITSFEDDENHAVPNCWNQLMTGTSGSGTFPSVYNYASNAHTGNVYFEFESTSGQTELAALPQMENISTLALSFYASLTNNNIVFEVGVMEDTAFVLVDTVNLVAGSSFSSAYRLYTVYFANYSGSGNRIAMRVTGTGSYTLMIDDLTVEEFSGCYPVSDLTASDIDSASITLSWTDELNSGASYIVSYWTDGGDTNSENVTDITATITDLGGNTQYYFSVVADCGSGESPAITGNWRTACGSTAIPYTEGFEGLPTSVAPACWTVLNGNPRVMTSYPHTGTQHLYFSGGTPNIIALPPMGQPTGQLQVRFWTRPESYSYSSCGSFAVGYMTDLTVDSTFVQLATWAYNDWTSNTYEEKEVPMVGAPDSAIIVLRHNSGSTVYYWYVDDLVVEPIPSCMHPVSVSTSAVTDVDADITVVGAEGSSYRIWWTAGTVTDSADITTDTYTLTGLTPSTSYTVSVATICDDGTITSTVSTTFRTQCDGGGCTLTIDMEDSYGDGWNGASINGIVNGQNTFTATLSSDSNGTFSYSMCNSDSVQLTWTSGEYDDEASFTISVGGSPVLSGYGDSYMTGSVLATINGCPTCPSPVNFVLDSVGTDEATFHWTAGGQETEWTVTFNGDSTFNTTTPSVTLQNLSPNTAYTVAISAVCGDDDSSMELLGSFRTACGAITTLPWTENFDQMTVTSTSTIPCWTYMGSGGYLATSTSYNPHSTPNCLGFYPSGSTSTDHILVLPEIAVPTNTLELSLWIRPESTGGSSGTFSIGYVTDITADSTFVEVLNLQSTAMSTTFTQYEVSFLGAPDSARIALRHNVNSSYYYWFIDDVEVHLLPSCPHPIGVAATSVFSDNITIDFNGSISGDYMLTISDSANYNATVNVSSDSTYTFNGLNPQTTYYISVFSDCGTEVSLPVDLVVSTSAVPTTMPYSTGFETGDDIGWMLVNGTQTNQWAIGSATSNGGSNALYISNDNGVSNSYSHTASNVYAYKLLAFDSIGDYVLSFDWLANGESCCDYLRVFLAPSTADLTAGSNSGISTTGAPAGWIALDGGSKLNVQTSWTNRVETFTLTNPGNYQLVFYWRNDGSVGTNPPAAIDNVQIGRLSCPSPQNIEFDSISGSFASFHWTPAGSESEWEVTFNGASTIVTTPDASVSGLSAMSGYTISVRAVCGDGDTSFATTTTFSTPCAAVTEFPWIEDFENEATFGCWSQTGDNEWTIGTGDYSTSTGAHSGNSNVRITHSSSGDITMLITPLLALSGNNAMLSFWHLQREWGSDQDELRVYYRTSMTDNWNILAAYTSEILTWTKDSVMLPNLTSTYQIGFEMTDEYGYGVAIDDIMVIGEGTAACDAPAITVTTVSETSATVTFESSADMNQVAILQGNVNATAFANVTPISETGNTHTFDNLMVSTEYTIGVRALCSSDNISEWTLAHVTTEDHPCNAPTEVTITNLNLHGGTINWTPFEAAQTVFEVRVYNTTYDTTYTVQGANSLVVTGLYSNVTYNVEVRAVCNPGNYSDWTTAVQFTTIDCVTPTGITATAEGRVVTVSWQSTGADRYRVIYFDENTSADEATVVEVGNGATTTTVTVPEGGVSYSFFVYAYCGDALSNASDEATVDILGIGTVNVSDVTLYPNPASTTVTVGGIEGESTVTVVDMNGRTVYTATATSDLTIDLSGMAKGAYFVRITGEQATAVRKLIVK